MLTVAVLLVIYALGVVSGVVLTAVWFAYRLYQALQNKGCHRAST